MGSIEDIFFQEQTPESKRKAMLIHYYFVMWSKIMNSFHKQKTTQYSLGYIDLYCGKGVYDDGKESTPITIMKDIINNDDLCKCTQTLFNDIKPETIKSMGSHIERLHDFNKLKYKPLLLSYDVSDNKLHEKLFKKIPCLIVLDPFGYLGITLDFIKKSIQNFYGIFCGIL